MAPESTILKTKTTSDSPYQLDQSQTLKASSALLNHIKTLAKSKEATSSTQNLLASNDDSSDDATSTNTEPLWLILTTKKHIIDKKRLKPGKIPLPHSINQSPNVTICLITPDPQRPFKDTISHPSFPTSLSSRITRVIGISKLKARYKSFESRRQLLSEHDVFLADDRVILLLPRLLGKIFYGGSKRPIPISLEPYKQKDASGKRVAAPKSSESKSIAPPLQVAKEIERTLSCAQVHLSPAATTSVRVGLANFSPSQVAENVAAVVSGMVEKFVTKGWRNIRSVHIKGPNTMALPIWLADELWVDEEDVLEKEEEARMAIEMKSQKGRKRKGREGEDEEGGKVKESRLADEGVGKEVVERKEKSRKQKREGEGDGEGGRAKKARLADDEMEETVEKKEKPRKQRGEGEKDEEIKVKKASLADVRIGKEVKEKKEKSRKLKRDREQDEGSKAKKSKSTDEGMGKEMAERREKLRQQKREARGMIVD
ncbi:hypothetical protein MMC12_004655 [Toensbergia leucococca]|nr:hypothetical protein [Toensbergia leucococca]